MQPDWKGFGIRLGRAIDRWPGGGQRAFADALEQHAKRNGLRIPTSYRTLVNYLNGVTRPSEAWIEAAAAVLRWNAGNLLTGEGPEREGGEIAGLQMTVSGEGAERSSMLVQMIVNRYGDLPMAARWMLFWFAFQYFEHDDAGWTAADRRRRQGQVEAVMDHYFGPLLTRPSMRDLETMALAASLTAAAYLRIADTRKEATDGEN